MSRPLILPWALLVSDNARHGTMRGRILLTTRYRTALECASALARRHWRGDPLSTPVSLSVTLYAPDKRRHDITNKLKLIGDALTGSAYVDDEQISRVTVTRGPIDRTNPRAEITVEHAVA